MDSESWLKEFCEVGKQDVSNTNGSADVDVAADVCDLYTTLTDNNLADFLKSVISNVF